MTLHFAVSQYVVLLLLFLFYLLHWPIIIDDMMKLKHQKSNQKPATCVLLLRVTLSGTLLY